MVYTSLALQLLVHVAMLLCIFYSSSLLCIMHLTEHLLPAISTLCGASSLCITSGDALLNLPSTVVHCQSASLLVHIFTVLCISLHHHCASPVMSISTVHLPQVCIFFYSWVYLHCASPVRCNCKVHLPLVCIFFYSGVHLHSASQVLCISTMHLPLALVCIISRVDGM